MAKCFAAIDAGSDWVTAVAASWKRNGDYVIEGFHRVPSSGFTKGMVTDAGKAADSVSKVLGKLSSKCGKRIEDVYSCISSTSAALIPSSGTLLLSKYGREITEIDVKKCVDIGSIVKVPLDKEPLHKIVRGFSIDGERQIKTPINLEGIKLEVEMSIFTINTSVLQNMNSCIAHAGFFPRASVFSGLASAYRVLTEDDRKRTVALIDICRDLTEAMVFDKGSLLSCKVLPLGISNISKEDGSFDEKELEDLLFKIGSIPSWGKAGKIILIGEGSFVDDLLEFVERYFSVPVRSGSCIPKPFEDLPPERTGYICSLGILDYFHQNHRPGSLNGNILKRGYDSVLGFIDRYF